MPFLEDLHKNWAEWPPARVSAAVAIGHKPKPPPSNDYSELIGMFPGGAIR
jgi:hypothetical protein